MRDIICIVEDEIVKKMNCEVQVDSFVDNVLTTCNPKWARDGKVVTDSELNEYTISEVNHVDSTITIVPNGEFTFSGTILILNKPKFFVGTPIATNTEWARFSSDQRTAVPFIWMVEPTKEHFGDELDPIERESDLVLVFLDSNDTVQWDTKATHNNRLQALYNMVDEFIATIRREAFFFSDNMTHDVMNFTKFGKETSSGVENNIIDANLTGIDLRVTVEICNSSCC